jgi:cytochrome c553
MDPWPRFLRIVLALPWLVAAAPGDAAPDPERGAQFYLKLPGSPTTCIDCHGLEPGASRNNLLAAADRPQALNKALNGVGAMAFLRGALQADDVDDLAAYLGGVQQSLAGPLVVWPATLEFGSALLGAASREHRVHLRNRSGAPVSMVPPQLIGEGFSLVHDCPPLLAPGQGCVAGLRQSSAQVGERSATLRLAADGKVWRVPLSGQVSLSPVGELVPDPDLVDIDLGSVDVGQRAVRSLALVNRGTESLNLLAHGLSGPDAAGFAVEGDCLLSPPLPPGGRCTLRVSAAAPREGEFVAALQWRSSGQGMPPLSLKVSARAAPVVPVVPTVPPPAAASAQGGGAGLGLVFGLGLLAAAGCLHGLARRPAR